MSKKEYFAYGSNLNFEQMAYRCPEATVVGTAKLDGYELAFRRGYLTILPKEGASVEGLIWSVTDHDESQLDCYEGYPTFYDKETMTVTDGVHHYYPIGQLWHEQRVAAAGVDRRHQQCGLLG